MLRNQWHRNILRATTAVCFLALPLVGCGDDDPVVPPTNGAEGTISFVVTGQAVEPGPVTAELQADARVELFADGTWQGVTGLTTVGFSVELDGEEQPVDSATVEARTYEQARVVLTNAQVDIAAGSVVGGEAIADAVTVTVAGGDEVVVTYATPVIVQEDGSVRLVLAVNPQQWLTTDVVDAEAVTAAQFEAAATLTAEAVTTTAAAR